jgi:hypothetical protein
MRKHQVLLLIALLLFCCHNIKAQDHSELFVATNGELPSIKLSNSNILAQQYNFILGYSFPKNVELFMNMGLGMFGKNNGELSFISENTILGVGANYLHPVNSDYKLGFELMAAYGYSGIMDNINYDHTIYQGCIKAQTTEPFCNMINFYGLVGVRYRSFYHYSSYSGLELYSGIGMRFGLFKKSN